MRRTNGCASSPSVAPESARRSSVASSRPFPQAPRPFPRSGWSSSPGRGSIRAPSRRPGLEIRPYVDQLYRHLAACDLAVVQGGLTTTMELTANRRPFLYFPLRNHFEQVHHVRHRLDRYGAGRCMDYTSTNPGGWRKQSVRRSDDHKLSAGRDGRCSQGGEPDCQPHLGAIRSGNVAPQQAEVGRAEPVAGRSWPGASTGRAAAAR